MKRRPASLPPTCLGARCSRARRWSQASFRRRDPAPPRRGAADQARLLQPAAVRRALRGRALRRTLQGPRARRATRLHSRRQRRHAGARRRRGRLCCHASLDAIVRARVVKDVVALVERENISVLLVTHDLEEALTLSDEVYHQPPSWTAPVPTSSPRAINPRATATEIRGPCGNTFSANTISVIRSIQTMLIIPRDQQDHGPARKAEGVRRQRGGAQLSRGQGQRDRRLLRDRCGRHLPGVAARGTLS